MDSKLKVEKFLLKDAILGSSSLQAKGTASAKRKLKRLSGREKRYINTVLHQISRAFINNLKKGDIVVMEKMTGIRNNAKHRKSQNGDFHS
jgi:hypothetical protein